MSFLYFIPGTGERPSRAEFEKIGLGYAQPPEGDVMGLKSSGPDGQVGFLIQPAGEDGLCRYLAEQQTWRKGPGAAYWVGMWNDHRPAEATLRRPKMIDGEAVKLRDGAEWIVPIARSFVRGSTLPQELVLGDDNQTWTLAELPEFFALCRDAESVAELFLNPPVDGEGKHRVSIEYTEGMRISIAALAVNYRVSACELTLLRLFTQAEMWAVLEALIDLPAVRRVMDSRSKKSAATATGLSAAGGVAV